MSDGSTPPTEPPAADKVEAAPQPVKPAADGGPRAWLAATGAFGALSCTFGYLNSFGVFQSYYQRTFLKGESPSNISWIGSLQVFLLFLGGLFSGPAADRYGLRAVFVPAALTLCFAVMMTSLAKTYAELVLAQGVLFGFACGLIFTPTVAVVGQHFTKQRAWAMGVAVSGASIGGIVFPIVLDRLLNGSNVGFGWSIRIVGFVMLALLCFTAVVTKEHAPRRKKHLFLPYAFRSSEYVFAVLGFFFSLLGFWTPIFYIAEYSQSHGLSADYAFHLVAIMNASSFFGRILPNFVADYVGVFNSNFFMTVCTSLLIFCWTAATTPAAITVWTILYGFFQGSVVSLISPCLARVCPQPSNIGTYIGMALACCSFGGLAGTPINGAIILHYGYLPASIFSGLAVFIGALCYGTARLRLSNQIIVKI